ncbi:MAG: hypothetical protein LV473_22495 [Nitrospira sp.]|nr:hypothetical protein [Nitrospira sp.]
MFKKSSGFVPEAHGRPAVLFQFDDEEALVSQRLHTRSHRVGRLDPGKIYQPGHAYQKYGVMLTDLIPAGSHCHDLFDDRDRQRELPDESHRYDQFRLWGEDNPFRQSRRRKA